MRAKGDAAMAARAPPRERGRALTPDADSDTLHSTVPKSNGKRGHDQDTTVPLTDCGYDDSAHLSTSTYIYSIYIVYIVYIVYI